MGGEAVIGESSEIHTYFHVQDDYRFYVPEGGDNPLNEAGEFYQNNHIGTPFVWHLDMTDTITGQDISKYNH